MGKTVSLQQHTVSFNFYLIILRVLSFASELVAMRTKLSRRPFPAVLPHALSSPPSLTNDKTITR